MKFSEYVEKINALLEDHPEYGNLELVVSTEGCRYDYVDNSPSAVYIDSIDLIPDYSFGEFEIAEPNAICLNNC